MSDDDSIRFKPIDNLMTVPRFAVGDSVRPSDRNNFGEIIEDLGGDRYKVHFVSTEGYTADKVFSASELRPAESGSGTAVTPEELAEMFVPKYINPVSHRAEKPKPYVPDMLYPGYTNAFGAPKCGKTYLVLAVTLCVHTGSLFLGRAVRQANCAWLELDMAEYDFQDYADKTVRGMDIPERRLPYFTHAFVDLLAIDQQDKLCQALEGLKTEILVIDSTRAATSINEDKSDEVKEFVRGFLLRRLRNTQGISVIAISHAPKYGTGPRGSGEWAGGADSLWEVKRNDPLSSIVTVTLTGRHAPARLTLDEFVGPDFARIRELTPKERTQSKAEAKVSAPGLLEAAKTLVLGANGGLSQSGLESKLRKTGHGIRHEDMAGLVLKLAQRFPEEIKVRRTIAGRRERVQVLPKVVPDMVPEIDGSGNQIRGSHEQEPND